MPHPIFIVRGTSLLDNNALLKQALSCVMMLPLLFIVMRSTHLVSAILKVGLLKKREHHALENLSDKNYKTAHVTLLTQDPIGYD